MKSRVATALRIELPRKTPMFAVRFAHRTSEDFSLAR
jgi:hypothetical protein